MGRMGNMNGGTKIIYTNANTNTNTGANVNRRTGNMKGGTKIIYTNANTNENTGASVNVNSRASEAPSDGSGDGGSDGYVTFHGAYSSKGQNAIPGRNILS